MSLGKRLKLIRQNQSVSQIELAKLTDIHYTQICRYEKENIVPSIEALKKIADVLNVSIDYLVYGEEKHNTEKKIQDKTLLNLFSKVEEMDEKGKTLIKEIIDAMVKRHKFEEMMKT